jgi:hypothetical protein
MGRRCNRLGRLEKLVEDPKERFSNSFYSVSVLGGGRETELDGYGMY